MSKPVVHVVAAPLGLVQDCTRCGAVVVDHRGEELPGGGFAFFFSTGAHVALEPDSASLTPDEPTCAVRDPADIP